MTKNSSYFHFFFLHSFYLGISGNKIAKKLIGHKSRSNNERFNTRRIFSGNRTRPMDRTFSLKRKYRLNVWFSLKTHRVFPTLPLLSATSNVHYRFDISWRFITFPSVFICSPLCKNINCFKNIPTEHLYKNETYVWTAFLPKNNNHDNNG